ncbi:unnamed protein product [Camellia sinensis]
MNFQVMEEEEEEEIHRSWRSSSTVRRAVRRFKWTVAVNLFEAEFELFLQLLEEKHSLLGSHSNSTKPVVRKMETEEEEEDECKTLSNALEEVLHKGSLMDRLQMLEKRLSIYMDEGNTSRSSSLTVPISEKIGQSSGLSSSVTKESDEDVVIATFEGRKDPLLIQVI